MNLHISTKIVLDTRIERKGQTYTVKLRVIHDRKSKYYSTGVAVTKDEFQRIKDGKVRGTLREHGVFFEAFKNRARQIIDQLKTFTFEAFEKELFDQSPQHDTSVYGYFEKKIQNLKEENRIGSASAYHDAMNSLKKFKNHLNFMEVTVDFLNKYERKQIANGVSETTIGIYMRHLRAVYNDAIEDGLAEKSEYPFGKRKYIIPAARNIKKALSISDVKKLWLHQPATERKQFYLDLWRFSYLCNGMNMADIFELKHQHLDGTNIVFVRQKTANTTRAVKKPIVVPITDEVRAIIEQSGTEKTKHDAYLFDVYSAGMTAEEKMVRKKNFVRYINKYLKELAAELNIEGELTTYTARHTFATVLKRSGASMEFISESLGHKDLKTTENYLSSFEDETKRDFAKKLTDFD